MNLAHDLQQVRARYLSRRWFLRDCGVGLAGIAASALANDAAQAAPATGNPLAPRPPHFPARARRVIYMFQAGAPSHLELFDNKPQLAKFDGTLPPADLLKGYRADDLDLSARSRKGTLIQRLLRAGADPDMANRRGSSPRIDAERLGLQEFLS